ncbi:MAG TPA: MarR family transcriptional regulator [Solirubrobacteraceae bacterium]|nr:MarR family transcriptional regulator [Solirubrobacteraceae bacterium]
MNQVEELRYLALAAQRDGNRRLATLLRPLGLTPAQSEVLIVLARAGRPLTIREVGDLLVCEPGSPSRLIASLADAGHVARRRHPEDGRAAAVELTDKGRGAAERVHAVEERFHGELRARIPSPRDVEATVRTLRAIAADGESAKALERRLRAG